MKQSSPFLSRKEDDADSSWRLDPQTMDLLRCEVFDQYRNYEILEHYIKFPYLLAEQAMLQLSPESQAYIIQKYYEIEDFVGREVIGKRIPKNRKEIDDIVENTGVSLHRVTRQVENIRRVYAAVEEAQHQINLLNFLEAHFALPHNLARKYCCLLFILMGKFSVSSKRRVQRASLQDICDCAAVSMSCLMTDSSIFSAYWSLQTDIVPDLYGISAATWNSVWRLVASVEVMEPDRQLVASLRDLKHLIGGGDALDVACALAKTSLQSRETRSAGMNVTKRVESRLKVILKSMISIGGNLSNAREFRDIFEDIVTKIGEPLHEVGLNRAEAILVLDSFTDGNIFSSALRRRTGSESSLVTNTPGSFGLIDWIRFVTCCKLCLGQLYGYIY